MSNFIKDQSIHVFFLAITVMFFSCGNSTQKEGSIDMQDSLIQKEAVVSESAVLSNSLTIFTNIEQIEYCVPLPLNEYAEDHEQNNVRAKHFFKHKTKKDNEIIIQGLFREDPSVSIEEYFKDRIQSSEEQGEIIEEQEIIIDKSCFYLSGYMTNFIDKYKFIEVVWLRKDEVVVYKSTYDIKDTSLWNGHLSVLLNSGSECK